MAPVQELRLWLILFVSLCDAYMMPPLTARGKLELWGLQARGSSHSTLTRANGQRGRRVVGVLSCEGKKQEGMAERYLKESNRCRPVDLARGGQILTKTGRVIMHARVGSTPLDGPDFVAISPDERLAEMDAPDTPMCEVLMCEQERLSLVQEYLENHVVQDVRLSRKIINIFSSGLAQKVFEITPWTVQKSIVGALGRLESRLSMELYPASVETEKNPLMKACVSRIMTPEECSTVIESAERYGVKEGWTTGRHRTHATTDIPIQKLQEANNLWVSTVAQRVKRVMAQNFGFQEDDIVPVDVFVVKYSHDQQRELSVHRDGALMTFSLLLNHHEDFEGGGTYFEESGRVYRPRQGVAVIHSGKIRHGGFPITAGTRYVLVGFCLVNSPLLCDELKDWRFGVPDWYVSSSATKDSEILNRVFKKPGAASSSSQAGRQHAGGDATKDGSSALLPAENPKYRREAQDIALTATQQGGAPESEHLGEGCVLRMHRHPKSGDMCALLEREGSGVVGHVLVRDAGDSDVELDRSIRDKFGEGRQAVRMAALVSVVVDREHRGGGLGLVMMQQAMAFLRRHGFDYVLLQQRDTGSGKLISWYESLGFVDASDFIDVGMLAKLN